MAHRREPPPLTTKPPFATDIPDDVYQQPVSQMRRRPELVQPATFDNRNSEYGAFDHYFDEKEEKVPVNRNSGIGDVGMGFMTGDISDDDSDDGRSRPQPSKPVSNNTDQRSQPNVRSSPKPSTTAPLRQPVQPRLNLPPGGSPPNPIRGSPQPPNALRAPAPGQYPPPAPPYQSAGPPRGGPPPHQFPGGQTPPPARGIRPPPLNVAQPTPIMARPQPAFISPSSPMPQSPLLNNPPHSPIVPLFARPQSETKNRPASKSRGTSEEALLLKADTTSDDFWRRFSMVVKKENSKPPEKRKSPWLRSYENGRHRLSAWVWILSVLLLVCIFGGIGVGWYFTHNKPNTPPTALGGSADENSLSDQVAPTNAVTVSAATQSASRAAPTHHARSDYHRRQRRRPARLS